MSYPIIISIDESKKQIAGYAPHRAEEFQKESAKLANKSFDAALKKSLHHEVKYALMGDRKLSSYRNSNL